MSEEDVKYISINSPTLTLKLAGKRYQARDGVFHDLPPNAMRELDKMIETMPHIRQEVRKVDMAEAARKAAEIVAKKPPAAVRGVVTSVNQASSILREAKKQQETQTLTGFDNPVNTSTKPIPKTVEVTEIKTDKPAEATSSLMGRFKK